MVPRYEKRICIGTSYITEGLIIPEELPSILSLIYSNIPPIKKGIDSRVGLGFRLGDHADFQVLLEVGPQTNTQTLGPEETERRRHAKLEPEEYKRLKKPIAYEAPKLDTEGSRWLSKWRESVSKA
ncbi:hypothetical protein J437_LFUL008779 [Ladona fulva]|uniref:Uncharacterized protein n=1 Tax=Ladona fulva TaxID=123851 RepID=A0A8K0JZ00_LADFU|nr:hypothetical protein J437_LFUL008779 [Ladona fulva]